MLGQFYAQASLFLDRLTESMPLTERRVGS